MGEGLCWALAENNVLQYKKQEPAVDHILSVGACRQFSYLTDSVWGMATILPSQSELARLSTHALLSGSSACCLAPSYCYQQL